jgi:hypothetical protein
MANITLPSNPVNGQTVVIGTRLFQYDSTASRWKSRVFQVLGDTSVTVTNEAPTITASLSEISLDTTGANVSFTYTVADVDSSVLRVSHSVSGIANSDLATVTHHRANNTVTITAGTIDFSGGEILLTVTDGRNNATDTVDVSAAYLDKLADPTSPSVFASITRAGMNNQIDDIAYNNTIEDSLIYGDIYAVNSSNNRLERYIYRKNGNISATANFSTSYSNIDKLWYDPYIDKVVATPSSGNYIRILDPVDLSEDDNLYNGSFSNNGQWIPLNSTYAWYISTGNWWTINVSDPTNISIYITESLILVLKKILLEEYFLNLMVLKCM